MTDEQYLLAKQMYLEGISLTKIGQELHISRGPLSKRLKADGVQIVNRQNIAKFDETIFDKIDTEAKAYWLGFLYADGCIDSRDSRNTIELSLKSSDVKHLEKFRDFLGFDKSKRIFQDNIRCRIQFSNKRVKQNLIKLGCTPRKSLILTFPEEEQVPKQLIPHFVRGYIDGDGSLMLNTKHTSGRLNILGTESFLHSLVDAMEWKKNKISNHGKSQVFSIEWCGYYVEDYLDVLYKNANIYLDRKYQKYLEIKAL